MAHHKFSPRADYRLEQSARVNASPSLSEKYPDLKGLTVEFGYFTAQGVSRNSQIKYTVNPEYAKSVFRLDCANSECVAGDFDLSDAISEAVRSRRATVTDEMSCEGWLSKTTIDRVHCHSIMRYKLSLEFGVREPEETPEVQTA